MKKNTFIFLVLIVATIVLSYLSGVLLDVDKLIINSFFDQLSQEQLESTLDLKKNGNG